MVTVCMEEWSDLLGAYGAHGLGMQFRPGSPFTVAVHHASGWIIGASLSGAERTIDI